MKWWSKRRWRELAVDEQLLKYERTVTAAHLTVKDLLCDALLAEPVAEDLLAGLQDLERILRLGIRGHADRRS